jgi:hypothetical protein
MSTLMEFLTNGNPAGFDPNPITFTNSGASIILRDLEETENIITALEFSNTLEPGSWSTRPDDVSPAASQTGVPTGFIRYQIVTHPEESRLFVRLRAS